MAKQKSPADQMLDEIRAIISKYAGKMSEKATYETLVEEASGWEMRLEELEDEEEDEDEE